MLAYDQPTPAERKEWEAERKRDQEEARARRALLTVSYYGDPLPVVYGTDRVPGQQVFMRNKTVADIFTAAKDSMGFWEAWRTLSGEAASVIMAICEAPVTGVSTVWKDITDSYGQADFDRLVANGTNIEFITGSSAPAWPVLSGTTLAGSAMAGTCYMRAQFLALNDGKVPDMDFEVRGRCVDTVGGKWLDAHPADVVADMLTDPRIGVGLSASQVEVDIGIDGNAASSYRNWCSSMGFYVSKAITSDSKVADELEKLLDDTHATAVWSGGKLKIVPKGAFSTGSYVPPSTSIVIDENELIWDDGSDPVTVERRPDSEVVNTIPVSLKQRDRGYEEVSYVHTDAAHSSKHGIKRDSTVKTEWLRDPLLAMRLSALLAQESIHVRNKYTFTVGPRWSALEPMDLISLSEPVFGLDGVLVRIQSIEDHEDGTREIEAVEFPLGRAQAIDVTPDRPDGYETTPVWSNYPFYTAQSASQAADEARTIAEDAAASATIAFNSASGAFDRADQAYASATLAYDQAGVAFASATSAYDHADVAFASATLAFNEAQGKADADLGNIAPGTITGIMVGSGTLSGSHIAAGTIKGQNISGSTIQGTHLQAQTISGTHIAGQTISGSNIAAGTISGTHIAALTISGTHIKGGTISGTHIAGATISGTHIAGGTITAANINTSEFKVAYTEDAQGNPTAGVKIFDATTPLKIGPGGAKVGKQKLDEVVVRTISAIRQQDDRLWYVGSRSTRLNGDGTPVLMDPRWTASKPYYVGDRVLGSDGHVWQVYNVYYNGYWTTDPSVSASSLSVEPTWNAGKYVGSYTTETNRITWTYVGTMASQERLQIGSWNGHVAIGGGFYCYSLKYALTPRTPWDNLDALTYMAVEVFNVSGTWIDTRWYPAASRQYADPANDAASSNTVFGDVNWLGAQCTAYASTFLNGYVRIYLNNVSGQAVRLYRSLDAGWSNYWTGNGPTTFTAIPGGTPPPPPATGSGDDPIGNCPAPETLVLMADATATKPAGELAVGDTVWTKHETTGEWGAFPVTYSEVFQSDRVKLTFHDGRELVASPDHRVFSHGEWRHVKDLVPGHMVEGSAPARVVSVSQAEPGDVVKITIDDAHTYVTAGLLSHNLKKLT